MPPAPHIIAFGELTSSVSLGLSRLALVPSLAGCNHSKTSARAEVNSQDA